MSLLLLALLAGCNPPAGASGDPSDNDGATASPPDTPLRPASAKPEAATGEWGSSNGALHYTDGASGAGRMTLSCRAGQLQVALPGVASIDSEERLSFGGGGDVEALVRSAGTADGVEAIGPAPDAARLLALLTAGPGASYGATAIGPLVPVPEELANAFVKACS